MNPYETFVSDLARLMERGQGLPLGAGTVSPAAKRSSPDAGARRALIFAPHPDDEVIIGGLPLRLLRERGWSITNVAVTLGSNPSRQHERWQELEACCGHIGFELLATTPQGLPNVNVPTRNNQSEQWHSSVACVAGILQAYQPQAVFFPHDDDWNSTHIGTHYLVLDALARMGNEFECLAVETEFWGAMKDPNLLVETSERDTIDLITALSFHVGEVKRNPYHLRLPAWLMDNVRRGGELVGGQGGRAPDFLFGTLYRMRRWQGGRLCSVLERGEFLCRDADLAMLFESPAKKP
jgi:LmbE family N-acetylglucosaminyl deacetylase